MILTESEALQHTHALKDRLVELIQAKDGKISFAEYMHHVLYAPGLGYYNAGNIKFGAQGDFITAPELGDVFAKCMAVQFTEILSQYSDPVILELGAGSGRFACDVLTQLHAMDMLPNKYFILELSPDLRYRQQELLLKYNPQFARIVEWLDRLPASSINGVIFANEVMDAMPVARFLYNDYLLQEYYVTYRENDFTYSLDKPSADLQNAFDAYNLKQYIEQPYSSEINLWLPAWIKSLSACLNSGVILLCDYGFARAQYYHPQRNTGTFMCHYKHHNLTNPFINLGRQDLTAHVDFTAVAESAIISDLHVAGYTNLASFLINCDITRYINHNNLSQTREANILCSPAEMGELFKVIMLSRMQREDFIGFKHFDKTFSL